MALPIIIIIIIIRLNLRYYIGIIESPEVYVTVS